MNDAIRSAAVKLLDVRDGLFAVQPVPPPLSIAVEDLRTAVLADAERRDVIPSDFLPDCPEGRALRHRGRRLLMAWGLFLAKQTGGIAAVGNTADLRRWCWEQADAFLADNDRPASVAVTGGPHSADCVKGETGRPDRIELAFLRWVGERGTAFASERPMWMDDSRAAFARRELLKRGLVRTNPDGSYTATDAGREAVSSAAVKLGEQDGAT